MLDRLLVGDVSGSRSGTADGTVLYSDKTELIGSTYPLDEDELEILDDGGTDAEHLGPRPSREPLRARPRRRLLEVYTRI